MAASETWSDDTLSTCSRPLPAVNWITSDLLGFSCRPLCSNHWCTLTLNVCIRSEWCHMVKLYTKFEQNWIILDWGRFCKCFQRGAGFQTLFLRGGQPNCAKFGRNRVPSRNVDTDWLLRFEIKAAERKSSIEDRGQISHFLTPVKITGGVGENAEQDDRVDTTAASVA